MTCPVVILPPSAALGIEARSKIERQALFHISGRALWARNGAVVRLRPMLGALILALAASHGRTLAYGAAIDAVYGDDPEGGPLDPLGGFNVMRTGHRDDFAALGVEIAVWHGCGYTLRINRLRFSGRPGHALAPAMAEEPYWVPKARWMAERGASTEAISSEVGRAQSIVSSKLRGVRYDGSSSGQRRQKAETIRRSKLRLQARQEATETGEPVEQIYARWGCQTVDRSRLWDQRRAAAQQDRHS